MIKNKNHIIFDWNGTLIDDAWVFVDILNALLVPRGLGLINLEEYRNQFCFPIKSFYKKLGVNTSSISLKNLELEFVKEYNSRKYNPRLFNNLRELLLKIKKNGKGISILSAANHEILNDLVAYYNINDLFDNVVGVNNYGAHGKLEAGVQLIRKLNEYDKNIIMIGDTDHDFNISHQLNIDCVLVSQGHQSKKRLKLLTDNVIDELDELI